MFKVNTITYDQLTDEEKEWQSNNGCGKEYAAYLQIMHGDTQIALYSDAMEPEDARFYRDLGWIKKALIDAYNRGKIDAGELPF